MAYYVVIRGPAAIGKTTVAKLLAKALRADYLSYDEIMKKHKLDSIVGDGIPSANFVKANKLIIPYVRKSLDEGKIMVLDGCFYRKEQLVHLEKELGFDHFIFTLKASLPECIRRNAKRKNPMSKKTIKDVYSLVSTYNVGMNVGTSKMNGAETAKKMLVYLGKKN